MVATALDSQLTQSPQRQQNLEIVQERLKSFKQFSDNDDIALKLLLHFMSLKDAEAVVKKPLKLLTDLKEPGLSENLYYVCSILYIKHLAAKQYKQTEHYYKIIDEIQLDSVDLGWKLSRQFIQNIHLYFTGDKNRAVDQINKLSIFYNDLNLTYQSRYVAQTCRDLSIPHQEVEVTLWEKAIRK